MALKFFKLVLSACVCVYVWVCDVSVHGMYVCKCVWAHTALQCMEVRGLLPSTFKWVQGIERTFPGLCSKPCYPLSRLPVTI